MGNQVDQGLLSSALQRARLKAARPYLSGRILDIGCGNGSLAAYATPENYVGVDHDKEAVAAARALFPEHIFISTLPKTGVFDTVVAWPSSST